MRSFSELTGKEKLIELLRWVFVPCAAGLAVLIPVLIAGVAVPPAVALPPGTPRVPQPEYQFYLLRILRILVGAIFVIAGAKAAPRYRVATAVVLAALWGLSSLNLHVLVHLYQGSPHYANFVAEAVAAAGGAACIASSERSKRTPR